MFQQCVCVVFTDMYGLGCMIHNNKDTTESINRVKEFVHINQGE